MNTAAENKEHMNMEKERDIVQFAGQNNEHKQYLDALVKELLEDDEWELPKDQRNALTRDLAWTLTSL